MVAKNQRKKQLVTPFQKCREVVKIDINDFQLSDREALKGCVEDLLVALTKSDSVDDQVKLIQFHKGLIRSSLYSETTSRDSIVNTLQLLLQIYVLPAYFPLRNSLEWTMEALAQIKSIDHAVKTDIIRGVCNSAWGKCIASGVLSKIGSQTIVTDLMNWTFTLNYMCAFEKDYRWLAVGEETLSDSDGLFQLTSLVANVFTACADIVAPEAMTSSEGTDAAAVSSSSEVVRFAECCGESMRAVATLLKSHRSATVGEGAPGWREMVNQVMVRAGRVLGSDRVSKDVVTSTAMGVISLQWLLRHSAKSVCAAEHVTGHQLAALIGIMNLKEAECDSAQLQQFAEASGVHPVLCSAVPSLPLISKCALLKACLSIFDDAAMLADCSDCGPAREILTLHQNAELNPCHATAPRETLFSGALFSCIMLVSGHSLSLNRLYGFQTLEAWLNRYEVMLRKGTAAAIADGLHSEYLAAKLLAVAKMLTDAWSHPSRQLSHIVPTIYSRLVNFIAASISAASPAQRDLLWGPLLQQSLAMPAQHRGKYQTMNILLPFVGAAQFFAVQPDIVRGLVDAVGERDISSSSSSFVGSLLTALHKESHKDLTGAALAAAVESIRPLWDRHVVDAVCALNSKMRVNAADYLIPEMLRFDAGAGPHLIRLIRDSVHRAGAPLNSKLWGMVNVCLQCRLMGLAAGRDIAFGEDTSRSGSGSASGDLLTESELVAACLSDDDELRLVALTALTASLKTAAPVTADELRVLRATLVYSLKSPESDHRHKVTRVVKALLTRVKESARVHEKELKKAERALATLARDRSKENGSAGDATMDVDGAAAPLKVAVDYDAKMAEAQQQIATSRGVVDASFSVCAWLRDELLRNLYPGTSSDREVMSLDLVRCMFETMGANSPQLQCFNNVGMVHTLLNLFVSSWDRSRKMAADLLLKFPHPLPGYQTPDSAAALLAWGCQLAGSPRLRESDAGALLVRNVYTIYCLQLGWELRVPSTFAQTVAAREADDLATGAFLGRLGFKSSRCAQFVHSMCDELADRLAVLDSVFATLNINEMCQLADSGTASEQGQQHTGEVSLSAATDSIPLCHGLILALKFCLLESHSAGLFRSGSIADSETLELSTGSAANYWQPIIRRVYSHCLLSLRVAMTIVAEAPSDVPFAPVPFTGAAADKSSESGGNTMAASYINTNSIMGSGTGEEAVDEKGSAVQRAVVAAWLLVKEASSLLATLVEISPPVPTAQDSAATANEASSGTTAATKDVENSAGSDSRKRPRRNANQTDALTAQGNASNAPLPLLTVEDITHGGSTILDALGRLKHMGAIAEAHSALQSISATVLRHGERSTQLCRLPAMWLNMVLTRLQGEQQVFILRRSAGFAYSFLSLLRAEPSNCKPTLLPVAMTSLLHTIEQGLLETAQDGVLVGDSESSKWKLSVHALNVVRLILCDAAVGPDVDAFVAQCTELAVRGFSSTKWAVRNSSMMVFSAVVQRAVDNDKNDSGGASACTATEFFQRFPTLFPFLLAELAKVTNFRIVTSTDSWPVGTEQLNSSESAPSLADEVHPCLYPLLLLLSKMRAALVSAVPTAAELTVAETIALKESGGVAQQASSQVADISLFVPLVESCCPQKVYQVRVMAAKALAALVPLKEVPGKAESILSSLVEKLRLQGETAVSANDVHGSLQLALEILQGLHRHVCVSAVSNKAFFAALQEELYVGCVPLLRRIVFQLRGSRCAATNLAVLRTIRIVRELVQLSPAYAGETTSILADHCSHVLKNVASAGRIAPAPYEPVLWREALTDFTAHALTGGEGGATAEALVHLMDSTVSEVREGVLLGCRKALDDAEKGGAFLRGAVFLEKLVDRCSAEREPPILQLTVELLCSLTKQCALSSYPTETRQRVLSTEGVAIFGTLVCRQWSTSVPADADTALDLRLTTSACSAVEVLGWLVAELLVGQYGPDFVRDVVHQWVRVLEAASSEDQISSMREAAAASVRVSRFLPAMNTRLLAERRGSPLSALCVRAWAALLTLLQDDDFDVRDVANAACSDAADSFKACREGDSAASRSLALPTGFVCNECYTLEHVSDNISAVLAAVAVASPAAVAAECYALLLTPLLSTVGDEGAVRSLLSADTEAVSAKIFEAEQANLYVEVVKGAAVLTKSVCGALHALPSGSTCSALLLETVGAAVFAKARSAVDLLRTCGARKLTWVMGGATHQKDVFQYLYLALDLLRQYLAAAVPHMATLSGPVVAQVKAVYAVLHDVLSETADSRSELHPWIAHALGDVEDLRHKLNA